MGRVYGFTPAAEALDAGPLGVGLAGEPLEVHAFGSIAVLAGAAQRADAAGAAGAAGALEVAPPIDLEAVVAYDRVARRLADRFPAFLPARLGPPLEAADLARFVAARGRALEAALERVRGRVQMTLRLAGDPTAAPRPSVPREDDAALGPGTRHLLARRAAVLEARSVPELDGLRPQLAEFIVEEASERHTKGPWIASAHHLVARDRAPAYRARAEAAAAEVEPGTVSWSVSGPLPAYAFAPGAGP